MRRVMGVIGHVDHGKTTLVKALTGVDTDRLPEEKRRGVSIALGFARLVLPELEVDLVDMPGHERFVRTMVSGATGVDAVLLVVAANEGIKPQTLEHVEVAALLGVRRAVVAVTKADLADPATLGFAGGAVAALLAERGIVSGAPVAMSAPRGEGLDALRAALATALLAAPAAADDGFAYLPLDRTFSLAGHGTVATGTLRRGALAVGDKMALMPAGAPVRLRGLQAHGAAVEAAQPGGRLAANLRGVEPAAAGRGVALAPPGLLAVSPWWTVELTAAPTGPGVAGGARLVLLHGTAEVAVRVRLLEGERLAPGAVGLAQLQGAQPLCAPARERFVLRLASPASTVGGGRVLDPEAHRLRRGNAEVLRRLRALAGAEAAQVVGQELARAAARGVGALRLARLAGVGLARAAALAGAADAVALRGDLWIARAAWEAAGGRLLREVERAEPDALPRRRLAERLPEVGEAVQGALLQRLAAAGALRFEGASVRRVRTLNDAARARSEREVCAGLAEALRQGGLAPEAPAGDPRVVRPAVEALVRAGLAVRTYDRVQKREVVFHREAIEHARRVLRPLLAGEGVRVSDAGAALGVSRKFSVPLLEHLDAVQFTRREGDRRVLGRGASA